MVKRDVSTAPVPETPLKELTYKKQGPIKNIGFAARDFWSKSLHITKMGIAIAAVTAYTYGTIWLGQYIPLIPFAGRYHETPHAWFSRASIPGDDADGGGGDLDPRSKNHGSGEYDPSAKSGQSNQFDPNAKQQGAPSDTKGNEPAKPDKEQKLKKPSKPDPKAKQKGGGGSRAPEILYTVDSIVHVKPPKNFTTGMGLDIGKDAWQHLKPYTGWGPFSNRNITLAIKSVDPVSTVKGFITIPRPEGYHLTAIAMHGPSYGGQIYEHDQTGNYLVYIGQPKDSVQYNVSAEFARDFVPKISPVTQDPRLRDVDRSRLLETMRLLRQANLDTLADALDRKFFSDGTRDKPIRIDSIASVIAHSQVYSIKFHQDEALPEDLKNPYRPYQKYLVDNKLWIDCIGANRLFMAMLYQLFPDDLDIQFDLLHSMVYQSKIKAMTSVGHARTQIRIDHQPGHWVIDATPLIDVDGKKMQPEDRLSSEEEIKNQQRIVDLHDENERRKKELEEKEYVALLPKEIVPQMEPSDDPIPENFDETHSEMVNQLERVLRDLLKNDFFKSLVKEKQELLPVRVYRVGKKVLQFTKGEVTEEALYDFINESYPSLQLEYPKTLEDWTGLFGKVHNYEADKWAGLEKLCQKSRFETVAWAGSQWLKELTFAITETLKSYHWHHP